MQKFNVVAMLLVLTIAAGTVWADGADSDKSAEPVVKTQISGKMIIIGPDGKKEVRELNMAEGMPEGIQQLITGKINGMMQGGVTVKAAAGKPGDCPAQPQCITKGFMIGPDGKMVEIDGDGQLPKNVQDLLKGLNGSAMSSGTITIVGPDGKKHTQTLQGGKIDTGSISDVIEKALKGTGQELPEEIKAKLKEAMKGLPGTIAMPQIIRMGPSGGDNISKKLDEIMKRLDKLEAEIKKLKK